MTLHVEDPRSWFTSRRERWLWASALLVTGAIGLTLVIGPELVELARHRAVVDAAFALALLLVGTTVVTLALGSKARSVELGIVLAGIAIGLLVLARIGLSSAERTHLIEYAALAALIHAALVERAANGRRVAYPAATAIIVTTLIGVLDEVAQAIMPSRTFDPLDIVFNTTAAVVAVSLGAVVRRVAARAGPI